MERKHHFRDLFRRSHHDDNSTSADGDSHEVKAVHQPADDLVAQTNALSLSNTDGQKGRSADRRRERISEDHSVPTKPTTRSSARRSVDIVDSSLPGFPRVAAAGPHFSEAVADRNLGTSTADSTKGRARLDQTTDGHQTHDHLGKTPQPYQHTADDAPSLRHTTRKSRPLDHVNIEQQPLDMSTGESRSLDSARTEEHSLDQATKDKLSKDGIDLRDSVDTTLHTTLAPAVTRQTIKPVVHEIREERITREIHTHDIYHRILPIHDVEVLPARHFTPGPDGKLMEISADAIPGRVGHNQRWEVAQNSQVGSQPPAQPRGFTARTFGDEDDDFEELGEDGVKRTRTTWVHPPTLESGEQRAAQTEPFTM